MASPSTPGCAGPWPLEQRREAGLGRDPDHPLRLAHQRAFHYDRVVRVAGRARTRFELAVRRGQPPLAVYASGDLLLGQGSGVKAIVFDAPSDESVLRLS